MASPLRLLLDQLLIIPDQASRQALEEKIKSLQHEMPDYAAHLVVLVADHTAPIQLRQLASVLLKQYISDSCWSEKSSPSAPNSEVKNYVRSTLCASLADPTSKIRASVAYTLAVIAKMEWPDQWPDLFTFLTQATNSDNPNLVHGSMRLLSELVEIVEQGKLETFTPILFARLLTIIKGCQLYNVRMRSRAVNIFTGLCAVMDDRYDPGGTNQVSMNLLLPWLQRYGTILTECLGEPDGQFSDLGLKTAILCALNQLFAHFPRQMSRWFGQKLLHNCIQMSEQCAEIHVKSCSADAEDNIDEELVDSDGNVLGVDQMVFQLCDLFQRLSCESFLNTELEAGLCQLFYASLCFMQLTDDKIDDWIENVDLFVEEEDEENCGDSIRVASKDLILSICDDHSRAAIPGFCSALKRHLDEAKEKHRANKPHWWKHVEGGITALGLVIHILLSDCEEMQKELNMMEMLAEHVFPSLESQSTQENPLLRGQAVWFLSRIVDSLVLDWQKKLVEVCVLFLDKEQPRIIQVSAARALYNVCEYANSAKKFELIQDHLEKIIAGFVNLATSGSEVIVNLALNSLSSCASASPSAVSKFERRIGPLAMACVLKYSGDPLIPSQVCEIVRSLAGVEGIGCKLETRILPTTLSVLEAPNPQNLPMQLPSVCLDLILSLMKGCGSPLSEKMLNNAFPIVVKYVLNSDDMDALASGRECIRGFVTVGPDQIVRWKDGAGNTGLTMIIEVICHFLKPETPELPASMVCRLVYALLKLAGTDVRPHLERIIRAVVAKMTTTEIHRVRKSLVVICAYFFNFELEPVVEFLCHLPSPSQSIGKNALEYVLLDWCDHHTKFAAMHDRKVSMMGLCKLLEYGVKKNPAPFKETRVGVEKEELLLHIFRLLLGNLAEVSDENAKGDGDVGMTNGSEEHNVSGNVNDILAELSQDLDEVCSSDENVDPDADSDYLRTLDIKAYLIGYFKGFRENNQYYGSFLNRVPKQERNCLEMLQLV